MSLGSTPAAFSAVRLVAPQSMRTLSAAPSSQKQVWKRPPLPNASSEPMKCRRTGSLMTIEPTDAGADHARVTTRRGPVSGSKNPPVGRWHEPRPIEPGPGEAPVDSARDRPQRGDLEVDPGTPLAHARATRITTHYPALRSGDQSPGGAEERSCRRQQCAQDTPRRALRCLVRATWIRIARDVAFGAPLGRGGVQVIGDRRGRHVETLGDLAVRQTLPTQASNLGSALVGRQTTVAGAVSHSKEDISGASGPPPRPVHHHPSHPLPTAHRPWKPDPERGMLELLRAAAWLVSLLVDRVEPVGPWQGGRSA